MIECIKKKTETNTADAMKHFVLSYVLLFSVLLSVFLRH